MDPLGAVALPGHGGLARGAVARLGAGLALHEAHGLAVGNIDGGKQRETHASQPTEATGSIREAGV
jgi:hypothetical protein